MHMLVLVRIFQYFVRGTPPPLWQRHWLSICKRNQGDLEANIYLNNLSTGTPQFVFFQTTRNAY
jgi:hypothetical protein